MQPSIPENRPLASAGMLRLRPRVLLKQISNVRRLFQFLGLALLLTSCGVSLGQLTQANRISTFAGNGTVGYSGDDGKATSATLNIPEYVAVDSAGNIFIAEVGNNIVRKIAASTGIITTVAGNGTAGFSGDGGPAISAELRTPAAVALDAAGNLYIADHNNNRVRKVDATTGIITTVAGNGTEGYSGDGGAATNAELNYPIGIALDSTGDIFIADNVDNTVREISATTGIITTVISNGSTPSPGFDGPVGIAIDNSGNLFIADTGNHRVVKLTIASGTISTMAGNGTPGSSGDGGPAASAELNSPAGVTFDSAGNLYINDAASNRIRKVSAATGIISTVAGDGTAGYTGDGGPAIDAEINDPGDVALDSAGNLYIPDAPDNVVRKVSPLTFASTAVASSSTPQNLLLQTTAAETITSLTVPVSEGNKKEYIVGKVTGCAVDGVTSNPAGTICTVPITFSPAYPGLRPVPLKVVTSAGNVNIGLNGQGVGPLAALTPGTMSTLAGEVNPPNCNAYNGPALLGPLCNPSAGAVDAAGNVYVAAFYSNTVSKIDLNGNITVIAGTGGFGVSGIGGPATSANIERPSDVTIDAAGNVYFSDETAQQVFKIDAITQIITSVVGNGTQGYSGDNGPAIMASLNRPEGVAVDVQGNLYVEDQDNNLIRKIDTAGIITTVAGNPATINQGSTAFSGDGGPATQANLDLCCGGVAAAYDNIAVDAAGNLFIGDSLHNVVREVTTDGIIHTVAGNNALGAGYSGDGGAATSAQLNLPMGVAVDAAGDLYIADFSNNRIRKVDAATQIITTVAGNGQGGSAGDGGPATQVSLTGPQKVVLDGQGNLYIADTKNNLIRKTDVSNPTLTFITPTAVGSTDTTDGPLGVVISDIGNAPLTLPPPSTGTNPSISTSCSLSSGENEACPGLESIFSSGDAGDGKQLRAGGKPRSNSWRQHQRFACADGQQSECGQPICHTDDHAHRRGARRSAAPAHALDDGLWQRDRGDHQRGTNGHAQEYRYLSAPNQQLRILQQRHQFVQRNQQLRFQRGCGSKLLHCSHLHSCGYGSSHREPRRELSFSDCSAVDRLDLHWNSCCSPASRAYPSDGELRQRDKRHYQRGPDLHPDQCRQRIAVHHVHLFIGNECRQLCPRLEDLRFEPRCWSFVHDLRHLLTSSCGQLYGKLVDCRYGGHANCIAERNRDSCCCTSSRSDSCNGELRQRHHRSHQRRSDLHPGQRRQRGSDHQFHWPQRSQCLRVCHRVKDLRNVACCKRFLHHLRNLRTHRSRIGNSGSERFRQR